MSMAREPSMDLARLADYLPDWLNYCLILSSSSRSRLYLCSLDFMSSYLSF
jgi:hypothetical protein